MTGVLWLDDVNEKVFSKVGGKAKNLYVLSKNGFNVPRWFVISTDVYNRFVEENGLKEKISSIINNIDFKNQGSVAEGSEAIKKLFLEKEIPSKDYKDILSAFRKFRSDVEYIAVRSSAVGEDEVKTSFAGQMDSFLFISEEKSFISSVKKCWASAFSERALTYRYLSNLPLSKIEVAVVVQKMMPGEISGVMFTVNPVSYDSNEIFINSTYGLGEGIVSGELNTDVFRVNKEDGSFSQELVEKKQKVVFNEEKGEETVVVPVEKEKQSKPSLDASMVKRLSEIGKSIEKLYGKPQDIEWTLYHGRVYILQTRPVTTLPNEKGETDFKIIWDNSNIIESFPGVTKPLTFSFARMAWSNVFRQTAEAMGVPSRVIEENSDLFDNMIGLIHGRVYYNLMRWYQFVSFFPGFKQNRRYMEQMMGVKESYNYRKEKTSLLSKNGVKEIFGILHLVYGLVKNYLMLDGDVERFQRNFTRHYRRLAGIDVESMKPWDIMVFFNKSHVDLLRDWRVEGTNDYFAMFFYGLVKSLTVKYGLDADGSLQNNLFCGEKDMESTKPTKHLLMLAKYVKENNDLLDLFVNNSEEKVLEELWSDSRFFGFRDKLSEYIEEYGFRCMNELKLEEKNLKDDPSFIVKIIKNYINLENIDLDKINESEIEKRRMAEDFVRQKLKWRFLKKLVFYWALRNARKCVRYRENLRLCRTKIFGLVREAFVAIGKSFAEMNVIENPDDIFYLELDEVFDYIKGTGTLLDLKSLIKVRKEEYKRFEKEKLPERFVTYGVVNAQDLGDLYSNDEKGMDETDVLKGISCFPGVVKNRVRVILSPKDDVRLNGEILVAEKTDPGWVPLYPSASGLLIERGSVLSHSAIVARELGLPTIVGVKDLIRKVKDGQVIKMDAGKGLVYLHPDKE
ncbi:MAG: hypothetical protein J7L32_04745 [Thermoplasmata archaeon]|nr:hypothetical protein [Thermoplasmata archaeon]